MNYSAATLDDAHAHTSDHRDEVERSALCGCFYCLRTFSPTEIQRWCRDGDTAICPRCGVDVVIGEESGYPISEPDFLRAGFDRWFTGEVEWENGPPTIRARIVGGICLALFLSVVASRAANWQLLGGYENAAMGALLMIALVLVGFIPGVRRQERPQSAPKDR